MAGGSRPPAGFGGGSQPPPGFGGGSQPPAGFGGGSRPPAGFGGSQPPGGFGGLFGGGFGGATHVDDDPRFIVAVVEVDGAAAHAKSFEAGGIIKVSHEWGASQIKGVTSISKAIVLREAGGKAMPTVLRRFEDKHAEVFKGEVNPARVQELAEWALTHGMIGKCAELLDKLVELNKALTAAEA
jgi:hypothetical protein